MDSSLKSPFNRILSTKSQKVADRISTPPHVVLKRKKNKKVYDHFSHPTSSELGYDRKETEKRCAFLRVPLHDPSRDERGAIAQRINIHDYE